MPIALLLQWLRGKPTPRPDLQFVFFTRAGCCLCDNALEIVNRLQSVYFFAVEVVDIDTSPELVQAHGNWVPVIAINGTVRFRGRINEVLLKRLLDAVPPGATV